MKPYEVEILVAAGRRDRDDRPAVPHPLRRHRHGRGGLHRARRRGRADRSRRCGPTTPTTSTSARRSGSVPGSSPATTSRSTADAARGRPARPRRTGPGVPAHPGRRARGPAGLIAGSEADVAHDRRDHGHDDRDEERHRRPPQAGPPRLGVELGGVVDAFARAARTRRRRPGPRARRRRPGRSRRP